MGQVNEKQEKAMKEFGKIVEELRYKSLFYRSEYSTAPTISLLFSEEERDNIIRIYDETGSKEGDSKLPLTGCLLQRTKGGGGYVGNAILWWAKDDRGYTTDPFKAKVWDTAEAIEYTKGKEDEYLAYPCSILRDNVSSCIDMQYVDQKERRAALDSCEKLIEAANRREKEWPLNGMDGVGRILFRSNELGGESGELQNQVKKYVRYLANMRGPDSDMEKVSEEIGDVIISAVLLAIELGLNPAECVVDKFNKTSAKYDINIQLQPTYSVSDLMNDQQTAEANTVKSAADYVAAKVVFPDIIDDLNIVKYYENIDAALCDYFDCDYEDIEEGMLLKIKQELITRNDGIFFGAGNCAAALSLIQQKLNDEDLFKVVSDPVSENSDWFGYIGFKWKGK